MTHVLSSVSLGLALTVLLSAFTAPPKPLPAAQRLGVSGSLDTTFGTGGKVITPMQSDDSDFHVVDLRIQTDGKLIVAGPVSSKNTYIDFAVVRYSANGTLDPGFGKGGKVSTPVGSGASSDQVAALQVQRDGRIVVAGTTNNSFKPTGNDFAVVRYTPAGALDPGFGKGGKVVTPVGAGGSNDVANALLVQPDGKIVMAGLTGRDVAVVRYTAAGVLDVGFGKGGKVITAVGPGASRDVAFALQLQLNGNLLVAGSTDGGTTGDDFALLRYTPNGTLDARFGQGGKVVTPVGSGQSSDQAVALQVQPDGKLLVAGNTVEETGTAGFAFSLVRYSADGKIDASFGQGGKVVTPVGKEGSVNYLRALQVQRDGKPVVAGYTTGGNTVSAFALFRYLP